MSNLLEVIKQAAAEAVEANDPAGILYGVVTSSSPLAVMVDQKLILGSEFLLLTNTVRNYEARMSLKNGGEEQVYTVHNALQTGDLVMMLRQQGGQKYIILDRVKEG